jgi:hypothetical protein
MVRHGVPARQDRCLSVWGSMSVSGSRGESSAPDLTVIKTGDNTQGEKPDGGPRASGWVRNGPRSDI